MEHRPQKTNIEVPTSGDNRTDQCLVESSTTLAQRELPKAKPMGEPVNCTSSELSIYLQGLAEGYLATSCLDIIPSALLRSNPIANKSYINGSTTVSFRGFPFLEMSKPLTESLGTASLMSLPEGSLAPKSVQAVIARDSKEYEVGCGQKWPESFAKFNPDTFSWKIRQTLLFADLEQSLETWPQWGLMHDGECWECAALVDCIGENAYGWLPTPVATDTGCRKPGNPTTTCNGSLRHIGKSGKQSQFRLSQVVHLLNPETCGAMNPEWQEWLMGWPIGQTDLKPLEMVKFQSWLYSHGTPSVEGKQIA